MLFDVLGHTYATLSDSASRIVNWKVWVIFWKSDVMEIDHCNYWSWIRVSLIHALVQPLLNSHALINVQTGDVKKCFQGKHFPISKYPDPKKCWSGCGYQKTKTENKEGRKLGTTLRSVKNVYVHHVLSCTILNLVWIGIASK